MNEVDALVDRERQALIAVLEQVDDARWDTPSLCAGWSVRDAVVHLLMPYELSVPRFLGELAAARFSFDAMADDWARRDPRSHREILDALRATAHGSFRVPGAPAEAPLSHLVIHLEDIYRPLGITSRTSPRSAEVVLHQMTGPRFRRSLPPGLLDGLALSATDADWTSGGGAPVVGTASALIATLAGRTAALDELSGDGAARVRERLTARPMRPGAAGTPAGRLDGAGGRRPPRPRRTRWTSSP